MLNDLVKPGRLAAVLLRLAGPAIGILLAVGLATAGEDARGWPNWRGPFCNGAAGDCGEPLVEDMSQAKVLWQSEQQVPNSQSYGSTSEDTGYCDPIIYQGRVYLQYFTSTGTPDERFLRMLMKTGNKRAGIAPRATLEGNSKPQADDVVLCMDALTGKTLWKTVFPGKGVNMNHVCYPYGCYAPHMVICAADGRIVSFSASGRIYCLRATDGKPLWESTLGPSADRVLMRLEDYVRNHEFMGGCYDGYSRGLNPVFDLSGEALADFDSSGVIVDGVLVVPEYFSGGKNKGGAAGVRGFDMVTGRHLWSVPNCSADVAAFPVRWRHAGKDYVICSGPARTVCIDPKTSKELWEIGTAAKSNLCLSPSVSGDYLVLGGKQTYQNTDNSGPTVTCYHLTLEKAEQVWAAPNTSRLSGWVGPVIYQDRVYWPAKGTACADLKTGHMLKTGGGGGACPAPCAGDGRLFLGTSMTNADPATLAPMGRVGAKDLGIAYMCSSTYADGRLYYRTTKHVVCCDLRKTSTPAPTPPAPRPALTAATPAAELVRLACGGDWPTQVAAAKLLTARGAAAKSCSADLVAGVAAAVAAGDQATASLLVPVIAALDPPSTETVVAASAKSLESKETLVLVAACAALREAGPNAASAAQTLARTFASGDTQVMMAAADALAASGTGAAAAVDTLLAALGDKDEVKVLQASRALMGIGAGAQSATAKLVDAFCAHPGPARFYLGEALRAIGPASIPVLVQKTSAYLPAANPPKHATNTKGDPALLRDTAKVLKNFGTAAKDTTPYLEKVVAAMPTGEFTWKPYIEEAIEIVNGRPSRRVVGMGKHRTPCPLGVDDGSKASDTTNKKGAEFDEP